ncbi:MAG TPA: DinB family protein [Pyrinomonadaceae bacterium]|nr:DinB family protein [Pyrinomonadaceae bacterium]
MHKKAIAKWPDTFANYKTKHLLTVFAAGPHRLRKVIDGLSDEVLTARPRPGKWCIKEIIPHVTDSEVQATFRIKLVLAQPGIVWPVYDQDIWAKEHAYQTLTLSELENSLQLFGALRALTTPLLTKARAEDWLKKGVHPEFGPMTLRNLLELYADHSERHIDQILTMRSMLGETVDMQPILEERLF